MYFRWKLNKFQIIIAASNWISIESILSSKREPKLDDLPTCLFSVIDLWWKNARNCSPRPVQSSGWHFDLIIKMNAFSTLLLSESRWENWKILHFKRELHSRQEFFQPVRSRNDTKERLEVRLNYILKGLETENEFGFPEKWKGSTVSSVMLQTCLQAFL